MSPMDPTGEYYRAAHDLLSEMDEEMRQRVEALLKRAEGGENTENLILDLITKNDKLRQHLQEILTEGTERSMFGGYTALAGNLYPMPSQKFVCPVEGHDYSRRITKIGENPGNCPEHDVPLIPASQKK